MSRAAAVGHGVVAAVALYDGELLLLVVVTVERVLAAGGGRHRRRRGVRALFMGCSEVNFILKKIEFPTFHCLLQTDAMMPHPK